MKTYTIFGFVFILTLSVLIIYSVINKETNNTTVLIPQPNTISLLSKDDSQIVQLIFQSTEFNKALKQEKNWLKPFLRQQLESYGLKKLDEDCYVKDLSSISDFIVSTNNDKVSVCTFLLLARKIAQNGTKINCMFTLDDSKMPTIECKSDKLIILKQDVRLSFYVRLNIPFEEDGYFKFKIGNKKENDTQTILELSNLGLLVIKKIEDNNVK